MKKYTVKMINSEYQTVQATPFKGEALNAIMKMAIKTNVVDERSILIEGVSEDARAVLDAVLDVASTGADPVEVILGAITALDPQEGIDPRVEPQGYRG